MSSNKEDMSKDISDNSIKLQYSVPHAMADGSTEWVMPSREWAKEIMFHNLLSEV